MQSTEETMPEDSLPEDSMLEDRGAQLKLELADLLRQYTHVHNNQGSFFFQKDFDSVYEPTFIKNIFRYGT